MTASIERPAAELAGKRVLITGASSGLGRSFAHAYASAGAHVLLAARRRAELEAVAHEIGIVGGRADPLVADVTDVEGLEATIGEAWRRHGPIHVLVNNSGVTDTAKIVDTDTEIFDRIVATNLRGAFFASQLVVRRMIADGIKGRIINVASALALKAMPGVAAYGLSKAGLVHLTRTQALEWARYGINANAICPGYVETDLNRAFFETEAGRNLVETFPRRRLLDARDLHGTMLFLASDASQAVTGAIISVDDGLTAS